MGKVISFLGACLVAFLVPLQVLAAAAEESGAEEVAHAEPSGMLVTILAVLSFATIIFMTFLTFRDNG